MKAEVVKFSKSRTFDHIDETNFDADDESFHEKEEVSGELFDQKKPQLIIIQFNPMGEEISEIFVCKEEKLRKLKKKESVGGLPF